ncbi:WAT1-related protein At1g09380-like [Curcuma longa]|uniref:WAT1-related protein At1g09380-like n=1 Tax=Curcuma longa TaxID=136217 RepID=UPI003D9EA8A5
MCLAMGSGTGDWSKVARGLMPPAAMVLVQVVFAGVNLLYKLALNDGMDVMVLVAYRYIFAAAFTTPLAFFIERKQRPKLTGKVLGLAFLCGLFGAGLAQNLYVSSMRLTSVTFVSAMSNLVPAMTFVLAISFRIEKLGIRTNYGQAKIIGTLLGLSGAMLLTFYKGVDINLWSSKINLLKATDDGGHGSIPSHPNDILGSFLAVSSCLCYALWLIIQAKLTQLHPCHCSNTALVCLMGAILSSILALCFQRHKIQWRLGFDIRLLTAAYSGILATGMAFTLLGWCIMKKGPVYASVFNPLSLVLVAILSSFLLSEQLYLGCLLGSGLIVLGLYMVLWGKGIEESKFGEQSVEEAVADGEPMEVVAVRETGTHLPSCNYK